MTEARSATTFVLEQRLPWPDDGPAAAHDGPLDPAIVHEGGGQRPCAVARISALGATLRGVAAPSPGTEVAVELANGQRPGGTVDWVRGGESGIVFKQAIDMLALINRQLISQPTDRRTMPRVELRCPLQVKWGATMTAAMLRNISARGLQVEGEGLPPRGTFISLFVEGLIVPPGEIVWRKADLAGIELFEELSWTSIIPWIREVGRPAG